MKLRAEAKLLLFLHELKLRGFLATATVKLDFQFAGTRYMLDFDDFLCKELWEEQGRETVQLRVYCSLDPNSTYGSSVKEIKDGKIVWNTWDDQYVPNGAQDYCDRMVKLKVFA